MDEDSNIHIALTMAGYNNTPYYMMNYNIMWKAKVALKKTDDNLDGGRFRGSHVV